MKLGTQHLGLWSYKRYTNDYPGLTFTFFTARSNLLPMFLYDFIETIEVLETQFGTYNSTGEGI